jgi:hypothetical protein
MNKGYHRCKLILGLFLFLLTKSLYAQSAYQHPNEKAYHIFDRFDIKYGLSSDYHTSLKYFLKEDFSNYAFDLINDSINPSQLDRSNLIYLLDDYNESRIQNCDSTNWYSQKEKPFLKHFYKSRANFFEIDNKDFTLKINPVLNLKIGKEDNSENLIFQNTRGIDIRGLIDGKVYFYTAIFENQQRFYNFIERRIERDQAIPGNGSFKEYESSIVDNIVGHDFLNAQGYVGIPVSKSISIEFGHGKHFIGNGYHSLLLSDYGHNYFYLKFNTRIWKFHYQNIFAELSAIGARDNIGDELLPKKYMATHFLNFKPNENFEIGLFESVIFNRTDHFEFQYLNPVILYRTVEQFLDSPDNVLLGLNWKWNFMSKFSIYGQVLLDELKIGEFIDGTGWWGNKYGLQLGAKYINILGVDHLDGQIEFNVVRPYTYSHQDTLLNFDDQSTASYSHFNQALAHPLGANFREILLRLRYQPSPKLAFDTRFILTQFGDDNSSQNFGGNILRSYSTRVMDFNNSIAQGEKNDIFILGLDVQYEIYHNFYLDLNLLYRKLNSEEDVNDLDTRYIGGGIRINVANQKLNY